MLWNRGWGAGYKCLRKDEKASGNTQSLIARTNLYCDVHISEEPGIQRIKEMDYKDHTTAEIKEQMVKSGGHSLMTTENSKDSHRKSVTTSLKITRPQAFSGQEHRMQKDWLPIHKPAPHVHPQLGCTCGGYLWEPERQVWPVSNSLHSHSITGRIKRHIFERLKFKNADFATYLIKGHYKIPKDSLITRRLYKDVLKKEKPELSRLITCYCLIVTPTWH